MFKRHISEQLIPLMQTYSLLSSLLRFHAATIMPMFILFFPSSNTVIFILVLNVFHRIVTRGYYCEKDAAKCVKDVLEAVKVSVRITNEKKLTQLKVV